MAGPNWDPEIGSFVQQPTRVTSFLADMMRPLEVSGAAIEYSLDDFDPDPPEASIHLERSITRLLGWDVSVWIDDRGKHRWALTRLGAMRWAKRTARRMNKRRGVAITDYELPPRS